MKRLALGIGLAVLAGCAAPKRMTTAERATLMETCQEEKPTGSMVQRKMCVPNADWVRVQGQVPSYSAARRPVSDFKEP